MDPAALFLSRSRYFLATQYPAKLRAAVATLSPEAFWWRPNAGSNSVGNLVLHLMGNARQWIVSGVGGAVDVRDRASEFDQRSPIAVSELIDRLEQTIIDVDRVLAAMTASDLHTRRVIQNNDVSVLEAIYHVVEHFSMHTGQIILLAKANQADRIRFYEMVDGHPRLISDFHGRTPVHPR